MDQAKEANSLHLFFFYRHVIEKEVGSIADAVRSRRGHRLPTVLTHSEAMALIDKLLGEIQLMEKIIYGGGLRLNECLRLRVQDIDFEKTPSPFGQPRETKKGDKDRITVFSGKITDDLHNHLSRVRTLDEKDRADNIAAVHLPGALKRKYPNASAVGLCQNSNHHYLYPRCPEVLSRIRLLGRSGTLSIFLHLERYNIEPSKCKNIKNVHRRKT